MSRPFACTLASSSAGNATLFSNGKTHILLDAGLSSRALAGALAHFSLTLNDLTAVLISHEHGDHIRGLPYIPKQVPVYASQGTASRLPGYPIAVPTGTPFCVNDVEITPFATPHDSSESTGFILRDGAYQMALATDMGHMPPDVLALLATVPVLFLEANYDEGMLMLGQYPAFLKQRIRGHRGHLSNDACAEAAVACVNQRLRHLVLMHLSKENNTPDLAYQTLQNRFLEDEIVVGQDVQLQVAPRLTPCQPVY